MMFYYRLERPWGNLFNYFEFELQYTCARLIDNIGGHNFPFHADAGQDVCGLWVFGDFRDVLAFWKNELTSTRAEKSFRAFDALKNSKNSYQAGRFCARINANAFKGEPLYRDLPMVHQYPSSRFHPRIFNTLGKNWTRDEISSDLIPHMSIPDEFVWVFFKGQWHRKSSVFGRRFAANILSVGNIDDAIPNDRTENSPEATKLLPWPKWPEPMKLNQ
jgi:hypothetical protein